MPGITREFPGVLPWHYGGDPWFTFDEADAYDAAYLDIVEARKQRAQGQGR